MIEFNKDIALKKGNTIHCNTKEKATNLLLWADSIGLTWNDEGTYINDTEWDTYKNKTCYELALGSFSYTDEAMLVHKNIIPYEDALLEQKPIKRKLKQY